MSTLVINRYFYIPATMSKHAPEQYHWKRYEHLNLMDCQHQVETPLA